MAVVFKHDVIHKTGNTWHIVTPPERTEPRPWAITRTKIEG